MGRGAWKGTEGERGNMTHYITHTCDKVTVTHYITRTCDKVPMTLTLHAMVMRENLKWSF